MTDSYFLAMTIPMVLFYIVSHSITTSFIPVFTELMHHKGKKEAVDFSNNLLHIIALFSLILSILCIAFSDKITGLIAIGYRGEALKLTSLLSRWMFCIMIFMGISGVLTGFLNASHRFFIPTVSWVPQNLIIIGYCFFLSRKFGIVGLAAATLTGSLVQVLIQLPQALQKGFRYRFVLNFRDEYLKKVMVLILPVFMGVGISQINALVDRMLASFLKDGSVAALEFANKIYTLPIWVFVFAIGTAIFPKISGLFNQNRKEDVSEVIQRAIRVIILIILPLTTGMIVLGTPLIRLLFERGAFNAGGTRLTATALFYYSFGMIGFAIKDLLNRVFYAGQDMITPMKNSAVAVIINIVLSIVLVKFMEVGGLAFATSISGIVVLILLLYSLNHKVIKMDIKGIALFFIKCLLISAVMGLCVYEFVILFKGMNALFYVLGGGLLGALVYIFLLWVCKVQELGWFLEVIQDGMSSCLHFKERIERQKTPANEQTRPAC